MCFGTRIPLVFTHRSMFSEIATLLFGLQGWIINKLLRQSGDFSRWTVNQDPLGFLLVRLLKKNCNAVRVRHLWVS